MPNNVLQNDRAGIAALRGFTFLKPTRHLSMSFGEVSMGVTAGLIRYPAEVFQQVKAEGTFYPPNGCDIQQCFLDRSWDELHPALRSFGPPLSLALNGDYGYDGGLDRFGWDEDNERDHYLGFVSPSLVAGK